MLKSLWMVAVGLLLAGAAAESQAALIWPGGTYTFTTGEGEVPTFTGATFGAFSDRQVTANTTANVYSRKGWETKTSINTGTYVQFTIVPQSSLDNLQLTQIKFDVQSSVNGAHGEIAIFLGSPSATADPATAAQATLAFNPTTTSQTVNFDFSDFTTAANQGVTVRIYGWNFTASGDTMTFDNVQVVPEPVNMALAFFGVGFAAVAAWKGLRRRAADRR